MAWCLDPYDVFRHLHGLPGTQIVSTSEAHYAFYDPTHDTDPTKRQPFATIILTDRQDGANHSDLDARGAWRLNVGVRPATYRALFGEPPSWEDAPKARDFTQLDTLLPHPIYAPLSWVCVVSPSAATWARVRPLVDEAHAFAREQHERRRGGRAPEA